MIGRQACMAFALTKCSRSDDALYIRRVPRDLKNQWKVVET